MDIILELKNLILESKEHNFQQENTIKENKRQQNFGFVRVPPCAKSDKERLKF
jgi:hypothetical protein